MAQPSRNPLHLPYTVNAGSLLVTAGSTQVCVWHVLGGGQLVHRITAHQKTATSVVVAALAGAQPHLVSAGLDGHVKVGGAQCWRARPAATCVLRAVHA